MCILFYTLTHPGYQFILASNRDEYFDRPALPAQWHTFDNVVRADTPRRGEVKDQVEDEREPWVLSGRDLGNAQAGTWLGMTVDLRIGVITNVRSPLTAEASAVIPSRGQLLKSFLSPPPSTESTSIYEYLEQQYARATEFEGFNLILFKLPIKDSTITEVEIGYLSNRPESTLVKLHPERPGSASPVGAGKCFGLSNTPLAEPWPKVTEGEQRMSESLQEWTEKGEDHHDLVQRMMTVLQQTIPLRSLADAAMCTCLKPIRIGQNPLVPLDAGSGGRWYGTRVSTVILVKNSGEVTFMERDIGEVDEHGMARKGTGERCFIFNAREQSRR